MIDCRIKNIITVYEKSNIQASKGLKEGKYPFYTSSFEFKKYYNDAIYNGNAITMGTGGKASINYVEKKFSTSADCYTFTASEYTKFLYYYLLCQIDKINEIGFQGMGLKHLQKDYINTMQIHIPSNYEKIVNILDREIFEIDKVIELTKKTIEDYKEYKKSRIIDLATKGLNKNVEMQKTDSEWIGNIPKHWKYVKINSLFKLVDERNYDTNEQLLSLYTALGVKPRSELEERGNKAITTVNYKKVKRDDIIVNKLLAWMGAIGFSDYNGVTSPDYDVYRIKDGANVVRDFYNAYFRYTCFNGDCYKFGHGIMLMRWRTYPKEFLKIKVPNPPYKEQLEIAKRINYECNEIDNLICNKEKLIYELENYKKSLIYEYVTGKKKVNENDSINVNNSSSIKVRCKDNIFAQAILLCRIIEKLNKYKLGRVKAEKTLYLIEKDIGFDFNNNYVREAAGPLCDAIYKCESIISKKNKWVKVKNVRKHIEYEMLEDFNKYEKYYEKYYSNYDNEIVKIIEIIKKCSTDEAEMIATLYASWNDFIIKGEKASDIQIVKDVRENWNDSKKRFDEEKWLNVLNEMKKVGLVPKGYGNLTIIKEQ